MIRFGPSGNCESFYEQGFKSSVQMPAWLRKIGLDAYEYPCGNGIRIRRETAQKIGDEAKANDVFVSVHAPYFINLASEEQIKRENSIGYIIETLEVAKWMGAKRIVVHTGSCSKVDRKWALETAVETFKSAICEADSRGFSEISICPEVLGKINQLGDLDEILEMCKVDDRLIPTIDFGHIHARGLGALNTIEDYEKVLFKIEDQIGLERLKKIHVHFSRIEYTKGGEKKHWSLEDIQYGPDFEPLAELIHRKNMEPVIICESRERMAQDALKLKNIYLCQGNYGI